MGVHIFGKTATVEFLKIVFFQINILPKILSLDMRSFYPIVIIHLQVKFHFIGHRLKKLFGSEKNKRSYLKIILIAFAKNWKVMPLILYNVLKLIFRKNYKVISDSNKFLFQKELNKFIKFNLKINQN